MTVYVGVKTRGSTTLSVSAKPPAVVPPERIAVGRHQKSSAARAVSVEFSARADCLCNGFLQHFQLLRIVQHCIKISKSGFSVF